MNVIQINSVCGVGSTGRIATDLEKILISKGHRSTIAYGRENAKGCERAIRIGSKFDNFLHLFRSRMIDQHGFGSTAATKKLIAKIKDYNPDIIHIHNLHGYYIHIGLLFDFIKDTNKAVIWTLHDCWPFTGHCAYFDYEDCERWRVQCYKCPLKMDYPKSLFLDRSHTNYQKKKIAFNGVQNLTIVTPSNWLASLVKESFLQDYPVEVIHNGIDLNVFKPTISRFRHRNNLEGQFLLLGVASPWSERKGYRYFLDLAGQLKSDEKIVLVGVSSEQIKLLPPNIIGIGRTSNTSELAEIYSTADLFINPTLEDNFPTTNLEALACGTPVITFNSGGSPECLTTDCGLVVERGDLPGLVAAISTVRDSGKTAYSIHCQKRARECFDKDSRFGEYIKLYERTIRNILA